MYVCVYVCLHIPYPYIENWIWVGLGWRLGIVSLDKKVKATLYAPCKRHTLLNIKIKGSWSKNMEKDMSHAIQTVSIEKLE